MTAEEFLEKFPDMSEHHNDDMLTDCACPNCGKRDRIAVQVQTMATITEDGTDTDGYEHEWDDDSYTECLSCHHSDNWEDFKHEGLDDLIAERKEANA